MNSSLSQVQHSRQLNNNRPSLKTEKHRSISFSSWSVKQSPLSIVSPSPSTVPISLSRFLTRVTKHLVRTIEMKAASLTLIILTSSNTYMLLTLSTCQLAKMKEGNSKKKKSHALWWSSLLMAHWWTSYESSMESWMISSSGHTFDSLSMLSSIYILTVLVISISSLKTCLLRKIANWDWLTSTCHIWQVISISFPKAKRITERQKRSQCNEILAADIYSAGIVLFILKSGGILPYTEDEYCEGVEPFRLMQDDSKSFFDRHNQIQEVNELYFDKSFRELFLSMVSEAPEDRSSIAEIKKSKWYQGPVFSPKELRLCMKCLFGSDTDWCLLRVISNSLNLCIHVNSRLLLLLTKYSYLFWYYINNWPDSLLILQKIFKTSILESIPSLVYEALLPM